MRRMRAGLVLSVALLVTGCGGGLESVPEPPPPGNPPAVPSAAALRPYYQMGPGNPTAAGTAFVVEDRAGKAYMLTAAHIMDDEAEWRQVQGVSLRVMGGNAVATVTGRPIYLGKPFDSANAGVDLVVWPLAEKTGTAPLKLAAADPKKNEWVWAVGQEPGSTGPQRAFLCKVTGTTSGGLALQQHDKFEMRGFSGGPIVNAQGEVVGSLLGGRGSSVIASRASTMRQRLTEANVALP